MGEKKHEGQQKNKVDRKSTTETWEKKNEINFDDYE